MRLLRDKLEWLHTFIRDADRRRRLRDDEFVAIWVRQTRDVAFEAEDALDDFLHHAERRRRKATLGSGCNVVQGRSRGHSWAGQVQRHARILWSKELAPPANEKQHRGGSSNSWPRIMSRALVRLRVDEGFVRPRRGRTMEEVGQGYLKELISRCMVQLVDKDDFGAVKTVVVHDRLHAFSRMRRRRPASSRATTALTCSRRAPGTASPSSTPPRTGRSTIWTNR
ncbi:unnamed protein product [Miscanthus lutarioriparius]|uniref:Rx N-terminal domain-containing protein n=1 Tax=Miscanthus lutarioriparius TaxID=422564 RepID=A0A811PE54_9POAL|nr:unnamed protein product [Miscanthus lutarioriparius]